MKRTPAAVGGGVRGVGLADEAARLRRAADRHQDLQRCGTVGRVPGALTGVPQAGPGREEPLFEAYGAGPDRERAMYHRLPREPPDRPPDAAWRADTVSGS
ncbi:hypothetical protein [Streptomyces sp. NPDC093094]|uniref:hypothetical protein n=1 Tax=Streptomyces sp. NPDC093094 TaxID=3366026 RepID=UPI0038224F5E